MHFLIGNFVLRSILQLTGTAIEKDNTYLTSPDQPQGIFIINNRLTGPLRSTWNILTARCYEKEKQHKVLFLSDHPTKNATAKQIFCGLHFFSDFCVSGWSFIRL